MFLTLITDLINNNAHLYKVNNSEISSLCQF